MSVISWLLDSDPSIRWQVMHDFGEGAALEIIAERSRVAYEGWGAALLLQQKENGQWTDADDNWMETTYTLKLLRDMGIDPADPQVCDAIARVQENLRWDAFDGGPYFAGEVEPCVNGAILAIGSYFGIDCRNLVDRLLQEQLPDGGWNCEAPKSNRGSFNTTICVLEGLWEYEKNQGPNSVVQESRQRAQEYLLERHMYKSLRTGQAISRDWESFSFPTGWHYDVLRGLDYMRDAGVASEERMAESIAIIERRKHHNGRWPMHTLHPERVQFDLETQIGAASRWNTLRALRVLKWFGRTVNRHGLIVESEA